jgi:hypothetical protein
LFFEDYPKFVCFLDSPLIEVVIERDHLWPIPFPPLGSLSDEEATPNGRDDG